MAIRTKVYRVTGVALLDTEQPDGPCRIRCRELDSEGRAVGGEIMLETDARSDADIGASIELSGAVVDG